MRRRGFTRSRASWRRRRSPWDMQTQKLCDSLILHNVSLEPGEALFPCAAPFLDAVEIIQPFAELETADKSMGFGGMHFQLEYSYSPLSTVIGVGAAHTVECIKMTIWSALCVIPTVLPGFITPVYLPALSDPAWSGDADTDILWKRIDHFTMYDTTAWLTIANAIDTLEGVQNLIQYTSRMPGGAGEREYTVRSRRRIKETEGLFLVRALTTNFVAPAGTASAGVQFGWSTDFWARSAVKANRR